MRRGWLLLLLPLVAIAVVVAILAPGSSPHRAAVSTPTSTSTTVKPDPPTTTDPPRLPPKKSAVRGRTLKTRHVTTSVIAVPGGSFRVVNNKVMLTHVVIAGDTLSGIAAWYRLMGGFTALYEWNHSTIGSDPDLIYPGEVLTISVPLRVVPKISPMYLALTAQEGQD
jgi:nucleoid-associated protein YgaU